MVTCSPHGDEPYYSFRGFYSVVLQAVVYHQGIFTHVSASWAGSAHNGCIFRNSGLGTVVESGCFMPGVKDLQLDAVVILPVLIRDPVYPMLSWLMRP